MAVLLVPRGVTAFTFILFYDEGVSINGSFAEIGVVMLFPSSLLHYDLPVAHPL